MQQDIKNSKCNGNNGIHNGHAYVDLGLPSGLLWATCNIGANRPEEYGDYFAWGETKPKQEYNWKTYKFSINGSNEEFFQYNKTDNLTKLDDADDAAHVNWGGNWRMPTERELDELCRQCEWTWTENYNGTGIKGRIVKSKTNSNTIFLPAAGFHWNDEFRKAGIVGFYWSRSFDAEYVDIINVLVFSDECHMVFNNERYLGKSVRPVCTLTTK